jgi:exosortase/archaeosortase family protein
VSDYDTVTAPQVRAKREISVTATTTHELTAPRRGLVAVLRPSMPRDEFFAGLYILGCANGLVGRSILTFNLEGWTGAIVGFELNVIVLFAVFAGVYLLMHKSGEPVQRLDLVVAAVFLILVLIPIFAVSWVAVSGLSLYILLLANDGAERKRGALILLALTVPMLWSRLLFQFFSTTLLELDATMVTWLLHTERIGNLVRFGDDSGYMMVTPACTSFQNVSLAFLCWIAVIQWANHRWRPIDLLWSALACVSVVAVNVVRIAVTGLSYGNYEAIHNKYGEVVLSTIFICLIIGFSVIGARRELFQRA